MAAQKEKYLFLYLDTGNGHKAPAQILKSELEQNHNAEVLLLSGFAPWQRFARGFFEDGYHAATAKLPAAYSLFYDATKLPWVLGLCRLCASVFTKHYLRRVIRENGISKVVCFHFAVAPAAAWAVRKANPKIPFIVDITDPFTAHPAWYLVRNARFIAHSQRLKNEMVQRHGLKAERIEVLPFIVDKRFCAESDRAKIERLKKANGIPPQNKVVLVAGGGEGLPRVAKIVRQFLRNAKPGAAVTLVVVCGRNASARRAVQRLCRTRAGFSVKTFGFATNMDELIKIADCVVTKAGASMLMQVLACRKPAVFSAYIHGQEKGNIEFVLENNVGWFMRKPRDIVRQALRLCEDSPYAALVAEKLAALNVRSDVPALARFIAGCGK